MNVILDPPKPFAARYAFGVVALEQYTPLSRAIVIALYGR